MAKAREAYIENENSFNVVMQSKRLEMDISYKRLAKAVGANKSTISNIEKGIHLPHIKLGLKISKVLDIEGELVIGCIYEERMKQLVESIIEGCEEVDMPVPKFIQENTSEYIEKLVTHAYRAGMDEGKEGAVMLLKMNMEELLDI